jgi:predicted dehydrogenase
VSAAVIEAAVERRVPVVALIGTGRVGARHLQALRNLARPAAIVAVDPDPAARAAATSLVRHNGDWRHDVIIDIRAEPASLPPRLDAVIVATTADVRRATIERLMIGRQIGPVVLEKVLCQSVRDCRELARVLRAARIPAWVNCNRRLGTCYAQVRRILVNERGVNVAVRGARWGLACNAVHFLDLIAYLTGRRGVRITQVNLDAGSIAARRAGFIELSGTIAGSVGDDVSFALTSDRTGDAAVVIRAESPRARMTIVECERDGGCILEGSIASADDGWRSREIRGRLPLQSETTNVVVEQLLDTGTCPLPSMRDAVAVHVPLLGAVARHLYGPAAKDESVCPIT